LAGLKVAPASPAPVVLEYFLSFSKKLEVLKPVFFYFIESTSCDIIAIQIALDPW
jgi:hypothetical protein